MRVVSPVIGSVRRSWWRWRLRRYPGRQMDFYFLSTGRCGTRFYARVLDAASNALVLHEARPGGRTLRREVKDAVRRYTTDRQDFAALSLGDYPGLEYKILWMQTRPTPIYGETYHRHFPFGCALYRHYGPERVRLVHLIRNPLDFYRSMLKFFGEEKLVGHHFPNLWGEAFTTGDSAAERVAHLWNRVNAMIQDQFALINNPAACITIRLEDVGVEGIRVLYEFLHLDDFDEATVARLMDDPSSTVRHSHVASHPDQREPTEEEYATVARLCQPLAATFGYER